MNDSDKDEDMEVEMDTTRVLLLMGVLKTKWEQREQHVWDDAANDMLNWCLNDLTDLIETIKIDLIDQQRKGACRDLLDHKRLPGEDVCCKCGFNFVMTKKGE
jgi:hypothetical protein